MERLREKTMIIRSALRIWYDESRYKECHKHHTDNLGIDHVTTGNSLR